MGVPFVKDLEKGGFPFGFPLKQTTKGTLDH